MVTMRDIAARAGVSMMTVSRVMNRQGNVSEKTAARIRAIADEMGYIPNSSARSLAARSSKIIAIVLRASEGSNPLSGSYTPAFLGLITKEIQRRGYYVMLHLAESYSDITFRLQSWNAEGAILLGLFDEEVKGLQSSNHIPLLFIDSYSEVRQRLNIGIDDYKGGVLAAEEFLANAHKTVCFYGPLRMTGGVVSQRCQGFADTLAAHNCPLDRSLIFNSDTQSACEVLDALLSLSSRVNPQESDCIGRIPTGIFASSDDLAIALYTEAFRRGLSIPDQLSIIGFDDMPISRALPVSLTTIRQNIEQKALLACSVLFDHLNSPERPSENVILDVELIQRQSVASLHL